MNALMSEEEDAGCLCKLILIDIAMNVETNANNDTTMGRSVMRLAVKDDEWHEERTSRET